MTKDNMEKRALYMQEVETLESQGHWRFIGRLAEYKYYNMDQVIAAALQKIAGV